MAAKSAGATAREHLPVVQDWVLASEAAAIMGVSRQYVHQNLDKLKAHRISNYVVIPRVEAEAFRVRREEEASRRRDQEAAVVG